MQPLSFPPALRVRGGWLVGADRGEWGGELVFLGDDGIQRKLLDENVQDIVQLGSRYVAVTGLAHLTLNHGMLYEVGPDEGGSWRAPP
jgi:hypothetical protein